MTSLLFVHGVATRAGVDYEKAVAARDRRFAETTFKGPVDIFNPYWGQFGADPRWGLASIPDVRGAAVALNTGNAAGGLGAGAATAGNPILAAARADFGATVASLAVEDLDHAEQSGDEARIRRAEAFWRAAGEYAERAPAPAWPHTVTTDDAFAAELEKQVTPLVADVPLGLLGVVRGAASCLAGAISNAVNAPFARVGREAVIMSVLRDMFSKEENKGHVRRVSSVQGALMYSHPHLNADENVVRDALKDLARNSRGGMKLNKGETIVFYNGFDEVERAVAPLLGAPGQPRALGTFSADSENA